MTTRLALVRRPGPRLREGIVTHLERQPVDLDRALRQWHTYVGALEASGWRTLEVPPADDCPDAVFVEDTVVVYGDLAIVGRPGASSRRPEVEGAEEVVRGLGYRIKHIKEPGTLDGGDVLKFGGTVWVGLGARTNEEGAAQLADLLEPFAVRVVTVPLGNVLHLKSVVTALPDGTVMGDPYEVADTSRFDRFIPAPESSGQVLLLGEDRVMVAANSAKTAELLRARGLSVVSVDISEFQKLEGGVTCLSTRLRR